MDNSWYSLEVSPLWVFAALLLAAGISLLLYSKPKMPWSKSMNILMGFLRWSAVFLIILLLINPHLEFNTNEIEKPVMVIALDNSESVALRESGASPEEVKKWIKTISVQLQKDFSVKIELLNQSASDSVFFDVPQTNLSELLKRIKNVYANRNLAGVILASDGILNAGQSPAYSTYHRPLFTIGLGDTVAPKDVSIQSIRHNKVAYQGNEFPISVKLYQKGFAGEEVKVLVRNGSKILASKGIKLNKTINEISFILPADNPGANRLTISISEKEYESTFVNNTQDIYIDVIDGKEEILILAPAPHPDINAIMEILSGNENIKVTLYIPGIYAQPKNKGYDAIIEHQAFDNTNYGDYTSGGRWYILGDRSNLAKMTSSISYLSIAKKGNRQTKDQVRGYLNETFSKFKLDPSLTDRLANYPPIAVPFGEYRVAGPTENFLFQQVGSLETDRPLLTFFDDGSSKSAILVGSGIWQWKLQEAASEDNSNLFKGIVTKTIQYLTIKTNKERLTAKSRTNSYREGEQVFIDTESYSDVYERIYGNTISLSITNESGEVDNYEIVDNKVSSSFNLGRFSSGIYQFEAAVEIGGKRFAKSGNFSVEDIQVESINLTADHNLLRTISKKSGGQFLPFIERSQLLNLLSQRDFPSVIHTYEDKYPLVESIWILLLITLFFFTEWFLRKYLGAY